MTIFISTNIKKNLEKIIHYDCKVFNMQMNKESYFIKEKNINEGFVCPSNNNSMALISQPVGADMTNKCHNRVSSNVVFLSNDGQQPQKLKLKENNYDEVDDVDLNKSLSDQNVNKIEEKDKNNKDNMDNIDNIILNNNYIENNESETKKGSPETSCKSDIKVKITIPDYNSLTMLESIKFDKRSFKGYLIDNTITHHRILGLIFIKSLFNPLFIRVNELIFEISLTFAISALLFTDTYIDERANDPYKVK
jgi:hypothetical protein